MAVLNTTSPVVTPEAPIEMPRNTVPSSSASTAGVGVTRLPPGPAAPLPARGAGHQWVGPSWTPPVISCLSEGGRDLSGNSTSDSEDVGHPVDARRSAENPARGCERAVREGHAVGGPVNELECLAAAREEHLVLADDVPAAQAREADRAGRAACRLAEPAVDGMLGERTAPRTRHDLPEPERRPRRGVRLAAVMRFDDLDVVVRRKGRRCPPGQAEQQVDG